MMHNIKFKGVIGKILLEELSKKNRFHCYWFMNFKNLIRFLSSTQFVIEFF